MQAENGHQRLQFFKDLHVAIAYIKLQKRVDFQPLYIYMQYIISLTDILKTSKREFLELKWNRFRYCNLTYNLNSLKFKHTFFTQDLMSFTLITGSVPLFLVIQRKRTLQYLCYRITAKPEEIPPQIENQSNQSFKRKKKKFSVLFYHIKNLHMRFFHPVLFLPYFLILSRVLILKQTESIQATTLMYWETNS